MSTPTTIVGRAFSALSKLLMANPWALLIAATVALVVIVVKNWDTIKEPLGAAWDWIKEKASAVFGWLKNAFLNFTPVGQIIKHWDQIKEGFAGAWEGIKNIFKSGVNTVIGFLNSQISGVEKLLNVFVKAYNMIANIPGNPLKPISEVELPRIPKLARGGEVIAGGWALVGERGPEILNLARGAQVRPLTGGGVSGGISAIDDRLIAALEKIAATRSGGPTYNIDVDATKTRDAMEIAEEMMWRIKTSGLGVVEGG